MGRSRQKEMRLQATLDAAESLIREHGTTDFSMLALAERAQMSPTTPYNLLGSKAGIMYALMNRSMDTVVSDGEQAYASADHPFDQAIEAARAVADVFAADPTYYRPLYRFLLGVHDPVHRPAFMDRGLRYWKGAIQGLHESGYFTDHLDPDEMARALEICFVGVLDLWVQSELTDEQFCAQTVYGSALLLLGLADEQARVRLQNHLRNAKAQLPLNFSFRAATNENRGHSQETGALGKDPESPTPAKQHGSARQ